MRTPICNEPISHGTQMQLGSPQRLPSPNASRPRDGGIPIQRQHRGSLARRGNPHQGSRDGTSGPREPRLEIQTRQVTFRSDEKAKNFRHGAGPRARLHGSGPNQGTSTEKHQNTHNKKATKILPGGDRILCRVPPGHRGTPGNIARIHERNKATRQHNQVDRGRKTSLR